MIIELLTFIGLLLAFYVGFDYLPKPKALTRGLQVYIPPVVEDLKNIKNLESINARASDINDEFSEHSRNYIDSLIITTLSLFCLAYYLIIFILNLNTLIAFFLVSFTVMCFVIGSYIHLYYLGIDHPDNVNGYKFSAGLLVFLFAVLMSDHYKYIDFNMYLALKLFNYQINAGAHHFFYLYLDLAYPAFAVICAGVLTFYMFPTFVYYYKFVIYHHAGKDVPFEHSNRVSVLMTKIYIYSCFFVVLLWTNPVTYLGHMLMPYWAYEYLKIAVVVILGLLKVASVRLEVQLFLNQNKALIHAIFEYPTRGVYDMINEQCKILASYTVPITHQSLCYGGFLLFFAFMLILQGDLSNLPVQIDPSQVEEPSLYKVESFSGEEMYFNEVFVGSKMIEEAEYMKANVGYYERFLDVSDHGVINQYYYRNAIEFTIWTYFLVTVCASCYAFYHIREIKQKKVKKE